ncbi:hypothetical protein [Frankia sp. Cas3]|uniref:hypothetical protein n=1 Tax=Frankia sp. Cas3 TaxID=3073926 RepID=UPI002AD21338|nr:hypothetical protein [Frankia sp. Cas3]
MNAIVAAVRDRLRPGGTILLADGCLPVERPGIATFGIRDQTVTALRLLIPDLRRQGFTFDRPSQLPGPATLPGSA